MEAEERQTPGKKRLPDEKRLVTRSVALEPAIDKFLRDMPHGAAALARKAITAEVRREMKRKEQADANQTNS